MQQKVLLFSGIFAIILLYTFTWKGAYKMAKIAVVEDNDAIDVYKRQEEMEEVFQKSLAERKKTETA